MKHYFSMIKFSHTIFALPFAMVGYVLGIHSESSVFNFEKLLLVIGCMVFARSAAMAFNRYLDRDIDEKNPRTAIREIPAGKISPKAALFFVIINCLAFLACAWLINSLCFALAPIALVVILGYSFTKRFTWLCHFVLGLGLSLAPIGAYLAVTGTFSWIPLLYSLAVLLWVSGFDIMYALQDESFDRSLNLRSIPVRLGTQKSLQLSNVLHIICAVIMLLAAWLVPLHYSEVKYLLWLGTFIFIALLFYQHTLVKANDLSKINLAFFTTNGIASVIFGTLAILDFYF